MLKNYCHNGSIIGQIFIIISLYYNITYKKKIYNLFSYSIMSPKMILVLGSTVDMYEIMSCFITGNHFEFENPYNFSEILLYENDSDLNDNYKM